jgi:BTB/POZ domain
MEGLRFNIPPASHGNPWFDDGNIILLVEDDDHKPSKAFKVHRGVLARQSEVFEAMFDIPQPTPGVDSIEQVDGCPVVRMYDLPSELSDLIKALYDGVCVM